MKKASFCLIFISCNGQKLGEDKLNMDKLDLGLDIESFYSKEIKKGEIFISQGTEIHLKETKTKEDFGDELIESWEFHSISLDSIFRNDSSDYKNLIGIQYNMNSWTSKDSLAYFDKMYFHKIGMMKNLKGDFIALSSSNESYRKEDFEDLLSHLILKNGEPEISKEYWFGNYYIYFWTLKDRLIFITSKIDYQENTITIDTTENKSDHKKKPVIETRLFIVNKKYKDSLKGEPNKGDWLYLKIK